MTQKSLNKIILFLVLCLTLLGTILIFSSTGDMGFIKSHAVKLIIAVVMLFVTATIPYEYYKKYSKPMLFGIILVLMLTPFVAEPLNGARRWINLGFMSFQPSELAKLLLIMHLSLMIEKKGDKIKSFKSGLIFALFWIFLVSFLVIIQPNVSNSILIIMFTFTLLYVGGAKFWHLASVASGAGAVILLAIITKYDHAMVRITSFLTQDHFQVKQAKIALGSGGFFGLGIGNSRQSDLFVPEPYGDFIFSILGEEIGFLGSMAVLIGYIGIFAIGIYISRRAKDTFGQLLAFGISFMIVFSAFVHIAVVTGMLPPTGVTLPFISFGGTSLIVLTISIGLLINIGLNSEPETMYHEEFQPNAEEI